MKRRDKSEWGHACDGHGVTGASAAHQQIKSGIRNDAATEAYALPGLPVFNRELRADQVETGGMPRIQRRLQKQRDISAIVLEVPDETELDLVQIDRNRQLVESGMRPRNIKGKELAAAVFEIPRSVSPGEGACHLLRRIERTSDVGIQPQIIQRVSHGLRLRGSRRRGKNGNGGEDEQPEQAAQHAPKIHRDVDLWPKLNRGGNREVIRRPDAVYTIGVNLRGERQDPGRTEDVINASAAVGI